MKIETFIEYLSQQAPPNDSSLNMYKGGSKANIQRRENLRAYLSIMQEIKPTRLFIGEAPGKKGCLISGVPFTDEHTVMTNKFFAGLENCMSDIPDYIPTKEATAQVVWECLDKIKYTKFPLMWNIYPFHPSTADSSVLIPTYRPNRTPSKEECELGKHILFGLLDYFDIQQYYAVGRVAERILKTDIPNIKYIRHPGRGGGDEFRKSFDYIYKLQSVNEI